MAEGTPGPETRPPQPAAGALSLPELGLLAFLLYGVHLTAQSSYLLFHSLAELFSIFIAVTIFLIAFNLRRVITNQYFLFVGIAYGFVAVLDTFHTLSYKGLGIFTTYDYFAPQLWVASRYLEALSMIAGFLLLGRNPRLNVPWLGAAFSAVTLAVLASIFQLRIFPVCFMAGHGLTPFKVTSEYVICACFASCLFLLRRNRRFFEPQVFLLLGGSLLAMIAMEFCFTRYVSDTMSDFANQAGHLLKIVAFYLVYKAVVVTGLHDPIHVLAREVDAGKRELEARRSLRASEEKYAKVFRSAPILVAVTRLADGTLIEVNEQCCRSLGFTAEDALGRTTLELGILLPEDRESLVNVVLGGGPVRSLELNLRTRSGDVLPCLFSGDLIQVGGETLLACVLTDITERKAREHEILRLNQLYDMLSRLGGSLVRSGSREALLQEICDLAVTRGGFQLAWVGWVDPATLQVVPVARAGEAVAYLDGIDIRLDGGPASRGTTGVCLQQDQTCFSQDFASDPKMAVWSERAAAFGLKASLATPIRVQGRPVGALMLYSDASGEFQEREVALIEEAAAHIAFGLDHLATEAQRRKLEAELSHAQMLESLGSLAGGVAHDMNNVLGAILALASAHLTLQPRDSSAYEAFETISAAATRGGDMVRRLLTFARRNPMEKKILDLNALVLEEARLLERTTLSRVRLELDLAPELPPIFGDASALAPALMNLCVNAVDAMPEGGAIRIETRSLGADQVEVVVQDHGSGMSEEVLAKALNPFFTTKEVGKGTGLGLPMVFTTVKAHGGQLAITSSLGEGTRVAMRFPASGAGAPAPAEAAPARLRPAGAVLNVLLVDDDELIQKATRMLIETLGHVCEVASSGEEALAAVEGGFNPELVILDMNMPGLGGKGTLPRLRSLCPAVPVLLATGRADQEALDLVAGDPGVTLLPKPFSFDELGRLLARG